MIAAIPRRENARLDAARVRILALLKAAGEEGRTTWDLIHATGHSAAARRVWELREGPYEILKVYEGGGVYRWIFKGEKPQPSLLQIMEQRA